MYSFDQEKETPIITEYEEDGTMQMDYMEIETENVDVKTFEPVFSNASLTLNQRRHNSELSGKMSMTQTDRKFSLGEVQFPG